MRVFSSDLEHTRVYFLLLTPDTCHGRSDAYILNFAPHDRYRMFEPNMDEYLDEEIDSLKQSFEQSCKEWEKKVSSFHPNLRAQSPELILDTQYTQTSLHTDAPPSLATTQPAFLASSSPARLKSNVVSTFTNLLLIPVSIVPRTVETVSGAAVHGIAMLDPRRWGGAGQVNESATIEGYTRGTDSDNVVLWEDEDHPDPTDEQSDDTARPATTSSSPQPPPLYSYDNLQLLLSLDVTLDLIHTARESLKRLEIFANYPGTYGTRVRETIEEVAGELLGVLGERHVRNGFEVCVVVVLSAVNGLISPGSAILAP